jgi:hypothetical protein
MMKQPFEHYNQKVAENDAELSCSNGCFIIRLHKIKNGIKMTVMSNNVGLCKYNNTHPTINIYKVQRCCSLQSFLYHFLFYVV